VKHEFGSITVTAETEEENDEKIECFADVTDRYSQLSEKLKEHLYALFLTADNQLIGDKLLTVGTATECQLDNRDLIRTAALVNASAVILVHNHPSGNPEPTEQDIQTTNEVAQALDYAGIKLLDHVIISTTNHSMKQHNNGPF
jgi:DNA repair protein RadC